MGSASRYWISYRHRQEIEVDMSTEGIISVLCADDHPLVRKGIAWILAKEPDIELVAECSTGRETVELFRIHQPDVTLIDLRMPDLDGVGATELILKEFPNARIIALT